MDLSPYKILIPKAISITFLKMVRLRIRNPFSFLQKKETVDALYSVQEFKAIIKRECARSDRTGNPFSLLVFFAIDIAGSQEKTIRLAESVATRVRSTDEVGWMEGSRLAVLLPDTKAREAMMLGRDLSSKLEGLKPGFKIYSYPSQWLIGSTSRDSAKFPDQTTPSHSRTGSYTQSIEDGVECLLDCDMPRWKRGMDILGASVCLLLFFPLLVLIGFLIEIVSPGPLFFKQERMGHRGKPFILWKFRTMVTGADTAIHEKHLRGLIRSDVAMEKLDDGEDGRLIPLAKLIRRLGLDEIPQLFNVLRGEMSLIGPRPCIPYEAEEYLVWHRKRCNVVPGLTGLWQVSGKNRTTHSQMMRLDIRYSMQNSLLLDFKIALKTLPAILSQALECLSNKRGGKYAKEN